MPRDPRLVLLDASDALLMASNGLIEVSALYDGVACSDVARTALELAANLSELAGAYTRTARAITVYERRN